MRSQPAVTPKRLLSIEDNADTCEMLKAIFEPSGYLILIAASVHEALEMLSNSMIDVFVVDIRLPDGSGIDLCRQVREHDRNTPIIVFSSNEQYRFEAVAAGANCFVDKSRSEELEQVVLRLMSEAESNSYSAKAAEEAAIRDELRERAARLREDSRAAKSWSMELRIKARAYRAFIEAGGTTAYFKRLWPEALSEIEA